MNKNIPSFSSNCNTTSGVPLRPTYGMVVVPSRLNDGKVVRADMSAVTQDGEGYCKYTWEPALYAYRDRPRSGRLEDIYWSCLGQEGIKANLLRLHIEPLESTPEQQNRLQIQDVYEFEAGYFGTSPQFVPRTGDKDGSTDGYIVCVVYHGTGDESDNGNEIWIFDAADLKNDPLCKLWHPKLTFGFTVHTTWMPKIARRTASYNVPVCEDYQNLVNQQPEYIQNLFNEWVYPKREPQV